MLYHVSSTRGLKTLQPRLSSHGKAYVYAVGNIVTGLLFGARKDDFDFIISNDENGRPIIYECYPNAFDIIYKGKSCSVYELNEDGFLKGITGWDQELVCDHAVSVQKELYMEDLYNRLLLAEIQESLFIHRYKETSDYKKQISEHIVDRLIRFNALGCLESDQRFQKYYKNIIEALRSVMDGHLLS